MKRIIVLLLCLAFVGLLPIVAGAEFRKTKIAVLDFELQGEGYETSDMGKIVAEWFITAMVREGRFDVVERGLLKKILDEQKLVMSGVVDEQSATKIGKLLGVKVIISGSVLKLQNVLEINARIIDVESASIITAESVKSTQATQLQDLVVKMSEKIIKNFPLEGYIVNRQGKIVTIDLGQRAGVKPGMEFIVFKEGKVIKHPKTGEVLDVERINTGQLRVTSVSGKISESEIVSEEKEGAINYGQLVKSVVDRPRPEDSLKGTSPADSKKGGAAGSAAGVSAAAGGDSGGADDMGEEDNAPPALGPGGRPATDVDSVLRGFKSNSFVDQRNSAKIALKLYLNNPKVLDAASETLLEGYKNADDRNRIDAMAYLCKLLGTSGQKKYIPTLQKVADDGPNRKLRGYAKKFLNMLN